MKYFYLFFCVFLSACASTSISDVHFYVLQNEQFSQSSAKEVHVKQDDFRIGLLPVRIPNYLKRNQIILKEDESTIVKIEENHRWAESLELGISRILALALDNEFNETSFSNRSVSELRMGLSVDEKINVDILAFEGNIGSSARIKAQWFLEKSSGEIIENVFEKSISAGNNYTDLVSALSSLLEDMAKSIVNDYVKSYTK